MTNAADDLGVRQQADKSDILAEIAKHGVAINDLRTQQKVDKNDILIEVTRQGATLHGINTRQNSDKDVILPRSPNSMNPSCSRCCLSSCQ